MKKIAVLLILVCSILIFGTSVVYADQDHTAVITEVPAYHTITVTAENSIKVIYNGETVKDSFRVERLSQPVIHIQTDDGYKIKAVFLNGKDITSDIHDGYYTFAPVYEDKSLNITVERILQPSEPTNISVLSTKSPESFGGSFLTGFDYSILIMLFIVLIISGVTAFCTIKKRRVK